MLDVARPLLGLARSPGIPFTHGAKRRCARRQPAVAQELIPGRSTHAKATLLVLGGHRPAVVHSTSVVCWCTLVVMISEGGPARNIPICSNHGIFVPGGLPGDGEQEGSAGTHLAALVRMSIAPPLRPGHTLGVCPPGAERFILYRCYPHAPLGMGIDIRSKVQ